MDGNCARLKSPFTNSRYLASGATGLVFEVSDKIVVKTVFRFENNAFKDHRQEADSCEGMKRESAIYDILRRPNNWHPNLVPCFLNTPSYLFLERQAHDLYRHISDKRPTSRADQCRWMYQISAAATWLEKLQLMHGDLRPINILLDHHRNVKLCDFDSAYHFGERIVSGHRPYYKMHKQGGFGQAGVGTEQFAIGGCFYFFLTGDDPDFLEDADGDYTSGAITQFPTFNTLMQKCWNMQYASISDLKAEVVSEAEEVEHLQFMKDSKIMELEEFENWVQECKDYLARCKLDFDGNT